MNSRQDDMPKLATHGSLSEALVIEVSRACEDGIASEVRRDRIKRWQEENEAAFAAWNARVERNGDPLGTYRKF